MRSAMRWNDWRAISCNFETAKRLALPAGRNQCHRRCQGQNVPIRCSIQNDAIPPIAYGGIQRDQ